MGKVLDDIRYIRAESGEDIKSSGKVFAHPFLRSNFLAIFEAMVRNTTLDSAFFEIEIAEQALKQLGFGLIWREICGFLGDA